MTRLVPLLLTTALLAALPAPASAADTRIDRHNEHVGLVVTLAPSRWFVQNLDYRNVADVRRNGSHEFVFSRGDRTIGRVHGVTARRWNVYVAGRSEPIGYVERHRRNDWHAYRRSDGDAVGDATGPASIQGAAAVLIVWGG